MALHGPTHVISGLLAGADLSSSQYKLVKLASTAGEVVLCSADQTDIVLGSLYNDPADGQPAEIAVGPVIKAQAEASLTAGTYVTSSTTGRLKSTTTANDRVIGVLLEASTDAGDLVKVLVQGFNY